MRPADVIDTDRGDGGEQRTGRTGDRHQENRIANPFEPRIELQRAKNADVDERLNDLHARDDQRERPRIANDADQE